jgi:uncharacterized membrane protein
MRAAYNSIAGHSVERLAALSDGIFAVAMTLLVLDLHAPAHEAVHDERGLWLALGSLAPQLLAYLMSFLTLGIFWNGQQAQLNLLARSDRHLAWIHLAFLFAVSMMPFSTKLLAEFIQERPAIIVYWANIFVLGSVLYGSWRSAICGGFVKEGTPPEVDKAVRGRIITAQMLYAVGALLCLVNTYWSIGFIVLVQLNYAIAPSFRPRTKAALHGPG